MNVNITNFMEERRANTEEIPYMEMKTSFGNKENIKPASRTQPSQPKQTKEESFGLSLPLGQEYEVKKQKLKQELRLDYRRFMSEKKTQIISYPPPQSHMLSLPIKERRSAKEKLQDERNKEYNLFLQGQEGAQKIGKASPTPQALERYRFGSSFPKYPAGSPEGQTQRASQSPENIVFSRRDVATITEPISGVPKVSRPRRRWVETPDRWGGPNRDHTSSEEEIELLEKEKLRKEDLGAIRRGGKHDNSSHSLRAPTPAQSRSVNEQKMSKFATGLMIGSTEGDEAPQKRKERYRLELLQQIAEQQKNKRKEKELELRVAATGAVDPEKKPDRIKQFGTMTREYEGRRRDVPYHPGLILEEFPAQAPKENAPPERPRVAFQSPSLDHSTVLSRLANTSGLGLEAGAISEDNHRSLSRTLGEIVAPRITGVRPPLGPSLTDSYQTPYDNAYYYYGARNPLDPNLANYGPAVGQQSHIPPEAHWPVLQPPSGGLTHHVGVVSSGPAFIASERLQQPKESPVSYQEALKQQIQERQQRRHREKVEKELYDAKIEAEMKAYEPWGRAGGGAPLRDNDGNLISDLKQMHKTNLEAYDSGGKVARIPVSSRKEPAGFSQPSVQARGNLFNDLPTPQQLHDQEKYKDCLKQQIEEKRRKEAEERERCRLEEEKEERRLAEQRAQIQREYEEEQERKRQKEKEQIAKNEELIRQAEERRKETDKMRKEAEEKENETLRKTHDREKQTHLDEKVQRAPSPPLPALQKKLRQQMPRPPSVESHRSSATLSMRSMSAPHSPPVPARRNEIRATEEKRTVIRELSALRRQLRSEQRRLEGQLLQSNRSDPTSPVHNRSREQLSEDVFEVARLRKQVPIRRPASHTTAEVNMQTLQEFNRLKYRDGASREEVRQAYPDPPNDDHSLDIQQKALLRQQQRTINSMRRGRAADYFDMVSSDQRYEQRRNYVEGLRRHLLLDSESAFIDPSGDSFLLQSRRDQKVRPAVRKPDMSDDVVNGYTRPDSGPDSQSLLSLTSTEIERLRERTKNKMTQLNNMREHDWRSGEVSAEEGEELWPQTPSTDRRVSIDTTATDPWLRPSSSDTLKRFVGGRRPSSRNHAGQDWEGPSTYHG